MGFPPTTTKGSNDANRVTTFNVEFPNNTITHTGITAVIGPLDASGIDPGAASNGDVLTIVAGVPAFTAPGAGTIGSWTNYTPTFSTAWGNTQTIYSARWRQIGQNAEYDILFQTDNTVAATTPTISLDTGQTISNTLIINDPTGDGVSYGVIGQFYRNQSAGASYFNTVLAQPNVTFVNFGQAGNAQNEMALQTANIVNNNELCQARFSVPIQEFGG